MDGSGSSGGRATAPTQARLEDLTARARIREAALQLFTAQGVDATSIREVARRAGVSSGLVQHHFGTKDGLRGACDGFVLDQLLRVKEELLDGAEADDPAFLAAVHPDVLRYYRYLARAMVDGSPGAAAMFDQMVTGTEAWLEERHPGAFADVRGVAAVLVAIETGLLAVLPQLSKSLGVDVLSDDGHLRMSRAKIELYSIPLLPKKVARRVLSSIDATLGRQRTGETPSSGARSAR
jgi:TetR/AcrR family transcriptional regulator, regulator of cefoperazone and chloramphenicol sensitivity